MVLSYQYLGYKQFSRHCDIWYSVKILGLKFLPYIAVKRNTKLTGAVFGVPLIDLLRGLFLIMHNTIAKNIYYILEWEKLCSQSINAPKADLTSS